MQKMDHQAFLTFLNQHYPYLYLVEKEVAKTIDKSGFGDVSINLKIQGNKVQYGEVIGYARVKFGDKTFT